MTTFPRRDIPESHGSPCQPRADSLLGSLSVSDGWFKIHRSLLNHPAFRGFQERWAFAELIALAAWKPTTVRYKERVINLERGQLAISIRDFAKRIEWDKAKVERFFSVLKNQDMIETATETGVTLITICNYCIYQDCRDSGETAAERKPRQDRDTEQRREEIKKIESPKGDSLLPSRAKGNHANGSKYPPEFEIFWKAYPKRPTDTKALAFKAWTKARKTLSADDLRMAAINYAGFCVCQGHEPMLVQTWVNREGWTASYKTQARASPQQKLGRVSQTIFNLMQNDGWGSEDETDDPKMADEERGNVLRLRDH